MIILNFSNDFYQPLNKLRSQVTPYYDCFMKMEGLYDTFRVYSLSINNNVLCLTDKNNRTLSTINNVINELNHFNGKAGIYGVQIQKLKRKSFIYIGISHNLHDRARQHLTGKNKCGQKDISEKVSYNYEKIYELVDKHNLDVKFFIWTDEELMKNKSIDYDLLILETLLIEKAKKGFDEMLSDMKIKIKHFNNRIG